jgi:hypothetical protein
VALAALLLSASVAAAPATPTPLPRQRIRMGDLDKGQARHAWMQRIENAIPVWLLFFVGLGGHLRLSGSAGDASVSIGTDGAR